MATGLSNKQIGQAGEFAVCSQLGKLGLVATPFSGNVPYFDVLVTDEELRTLPLQVKATFGNRDWIVGSALDWMAVDLNHETKEQHVLGPKEIRHPDLIYVYVWLSRAPGVLDRYFILTEREVQEILVKGYDKWLSGLKPPYIRPKKYDSFHIIISLSELDHFENNWDLIRSRLS
ncbi:MAG: hypothetical protein HZC36_14130 [Armatimonadetes bacterium]|nr:hypothetical protein [Armatimonadota bacterium]